MDHPTYVDAVRTESAALVSAAAAAPPDNRVPSCPDWDVADLMRHIGTVQRWVTGLVDGTHDDTSWRRDVSPPADAAVLPEWVREGSFGLVTALEATAPDATVWTFTGPGPASFWSRRQAHEVALHRVDAELATGVARPIDGDLAGDGIDEFFDVIVPFRLGERLVGTGETLHFHRTDGEGEWLVRLTPDGAEIERAHAKGDVAIRGSASDLLLVLRDRIGLDSVEVFGDVALVDRWHDLSSI